MSHGGGFTGVQLDKTCFANDLKQLPPDVMDAFREKIKLLLNNPGAGSLKLHALGGYYPTVYSINITVGKGKAYKATFNKEGSIAIFLRAGTHKQIDKNPR